MNISEEIVARAYDKAGEEPLTETELSNKSSTRWRVIKDYYLATILETLSQTEWTCLITRAELEESDIDNYTDYTYVYTLPIDCAKPISLASEAEYIVEGNILYTDDSAAVLVYVTNGYTGQTVYKLPDEQPTEDTFSAGEYYTYDEDTDTYTLADTYDADTTYYVVDEQDYEGYNDLEFDPLLSQYIETMLAAKICLKLTGKEQLYQLLYNEAMLMENRAAKATKAYRYNKENGSKRWSEILGLPDYGEGL